MVALYNTMQIGVVVMQADLSPWEEAALTIVHNEYDYQRRERAKHG